MRLRVRELLAGCIVLAAAFILGSCSSTPLSDGKSVSPHPSRSPAAGHSPGDPLRPTKSPTPKPPASSAGGSSVVSKIVFVRVGQGDAIVIESGAWTGLVDGGPPGSADEIEAVLRKLDTKRLDALVVTHPHQDHIGGLPEIVSDYRPKLVLLPPGGGSSTYRSVKAQIKRTANRTVVADKGQRFSFGKIKARVLSPPHAASEPNEASVVLLLNAAGKRILLTGDLTGTNEVMVGDAVERGPPVYLLKVAHHGSRYSTGASFLDDVDPRFAVICVGPNSYGHPTPETIRRLRTSGARIFATQKNGTITVTIAPSGKAAWSFSRSSKPVTGAGGFGNSSSTAGGSSGSGSATAGGGTIVFVTETGECYHRGTCQYLSRSKIKISLKEAKAQGYRPCRVCDPPR